MEVDHATSSTVAPDEPWFCLLGPGGDDAAADQPSRHGALSHLPPWREPDGNQPRLGTPSLGMGAGGEQGIHRGFNDGTVYPQKRGENYIYEGLILCFLKSFWRYHDETNVVGYYAKPVQAQPVIPHELSMLDKGFFSGHGIVIDPAMALHVVRTTEDLCRTLWVFRYYDLDDRQFKPYGEALVRLIDFIRAIASMRDGSAPKVNILAHSMGGLLVRKAVQCTYPQGGRKADEYINRIVTLGTPSAHPGPDYLRPGFLRQERGLLWRLH